MMVLSSRRVVLWLILSATMVALFVNMSGVLHDLFVRSSPEASADQRHGHHIPTFQQQNSYIPNIPTVDEVKKSHQLGGRPLEEISQDDPQLVDFVRRRLLVAPSHEPYKLNDPRRKDFSQYDQTATLLKLMGSRHDDKSGFFIECGAYDGEMYSNTLYFERERGWSGLLVEADPANFVLLMSKNRRAYSMQACLSPTAHPVVLELVAAMAGGGINNYWSLFNQKEKTRDRRYTALCVPLYSALLALNTTTVNYFSLDVEGAELPILKTIPFDKVDIPLLSVEFSVFPAPSDQARREAEVVRRREANEFFLRMKTPRYEEASVGFLDQFFIKVSP